MKRNIPLTGFTVEFYRCLRIFFKIFFEEFGQCFKCIIKTIRLYRNDILIDLRVIKTNYKTVTIEKIKEYKNKK